MWLRLPPLGTVTPEHCSSDIYPLYLFNYSGCSKLGNGKMDENGTIAFLLWSWASLRLLLWSQASPPGSHHQRWQHSSDSFAMEWPWTHYWCCRADWKIPFQKGYRTWPGILLRAKKRYRRLQWPDEWITRWKGHVFFLNQYLQA